MKKRIVALTLCLALLLLALAGCARNEADKGAYIRMYLSEPVYDLDPLSAFDNQATLQVVSLIYEGLFTVDEDGDVENAMVEEYEYVEDDEKGVYKLALHLKDSKWSDGVPVTASDFQFAFLRLFTTGTHSPAVGMLFDIKNARNIAAGQDSRDHLGVVVPDPQTLEIEFERNIDIDTFLPILASPALYPLRADKMDLNEHWNLIGDEVICNGPFRISSMNFTEADGFMLERNSYYYLDREKDDVDKYVTPYRIIVDYSTPAEDQLAKLNSTEKGALYYFGYIPLKARTAENEKLLKKLDVTPSNSTHVYYMNQSVAPFDNAQVRKALSMALDRNAMAEAIVYAEAATALVPQTVLYRADKSATFRDKAESYLSASADLEAAKQLLKDAGVTASDYAFTLTVNADSEEHVAMGELAVAAWKALGFKVVLITGGAQEIVTVDSKGENVFTGAHPSAYREALKAGKFDVIALDLVATAPTALSYLAPFAAAFSGNGYTMSQGENGQYVYTVAPHVTGYNSADYNAKIDAAQNEQNEKKRAALLEEAEAILMNDMPAIPVIYNQNTSLVGKKLSKVKSNFFCPNVFNDTKLSGYWKIAIRDEFVIVVPATETPEEGEE